jgi:hypothetical protein
MALVTPSRPAPAPHADCSETESARRCGGPQDRALYQCECGMSFTASVSTSVGCPHCGTDQAW